MSFRLPKKFPQFSDLKGILAQSKETENALYQTVQLIIQRLDQVKQVVEEQIAALQDAVTNILANVAPKTASYHTKNNETAVLPNSVQLLAGPGIIFDDSVPHKRTIKTDLASHYDCPLSDGDLIEASIIFAAGECVIVQVPV